MTDQQVVVVGAGTAGITLAEALRVHGHTGPIIVVGEEHHPPYSRPPLSKQVLDGTWPADRAGLRTPEELSRLGVEVRTGVAATGVDVAHRRLITTAESLPFDVLVLAPGNQPSQPVELAGAQGLHSLDDAHALRRALAGEGPVAVIGSGVLAQELASAAIKAGHATTLIGRGGRLGLGAVGDLLSAPLAGRARSADVEPVGHGQGLVRAGWRPGHRAGLTCPGPTPTRTPRRGCLSAAPDGVFAVTRICRRAAPSRRGESGQLIAPGTAALHHGW